MDKSARNLWVDWGPLGVLARDRRLHPEKSSRRAGFSTRENLNAQGVKDLKRVGAPVGRKADSALNPKGLSHVVTERPASPACGQSWGQSQNSGYPHDNHHHLSFLSFLIFKKDGDLNAPGMDPGRN
ncbi:hypothetical protein [Pararhodobacter marinus]|uniref:hypothetical protein n=1 Tax=Pararhodobacter marinus TaxID=2184063 RepID=UPI003515245B